MEYDQKKQKKWTVMSVVEFKIQSYKSGNRNSIITTSKCHWCH